MRFNKIQPPLIHIVSVQRIRSSVCAVSLLSSQLWPVYRVPWAGDFLQESPVGKHGDGAKASPVPSQSKVFSPRSSFECSVRVGESPRGVALLWLWDKTGQVADVYMCCINLMQSKTDF